MLRLLLLALLLPAPAASQSGQRPTEFLRGICFTAHTASSKSAGSLTKWVADQRINLVAIDFFGVAHSYERIAWKKIATLVQRLKKQRVTVLADYRPSTSEPGKGIRGEAPDLCLSDPKIRANITGWGLWILEKVPGIDILTIYNPLPRFERDKNCPKCSKRDDTAILQEFLAEWSAKLRKEHPKVLLGAVLPAGADYYRRFRKSLDVYVPFCSLIAPKGEESCGPGIMKKLARDCRSLTRLGPVLPLVKLYWRQETRNTTEDVLHAMDEAKLNGMSGFFLWYHSLLTGEVDTNTPFDLPDYDLEKIEAKYRELGGAKRRRR